MKDTSRDFSTSIQAELKLSSTTHEWHSQIPQSKQLKISQLLFSLIMGQSKQEFIEKNCYNKLNNDISDYWEFPGRPLDILITDKNAC